MHRLRPIVPARGVQKTVSVLLAGAIAAGGPIEAIEEGQEWIDVPTRWAGDQPCYFLRVEGTSMADMIHDGDWVLVRKEAGFINGKVYVCILPDTNEATLKYVHKVRGGYRLIPANPEFKPVFVRRLELRGRVVKVIRDLD